MIFLNTVTVTKGHLLVWGTVARTRSGSVASTRRFSSFRPTPGGPAHRRWSSQRPVFIQTSPDHPHLSWWSAGICRSLGKASPPPRTLRSPRGQSRRFQSGHTWSWLATDRSWSWSWSLTLSSLSLSSRRDTQPGLSGNQLLPPPRSSVGQPVS